MRQLLAGILVACACAGSALAQVSIGIATPGVSIGVQLPLYPNLVAVPGYPVYYAPALNTNYFFYDGLYWVYQGDNWYASTWYNGPWQLVAPMYVPVYVLRVPVRYYRVPPPYFRAWRPEAPPRWGEYWGDDWAQRRKGWDQWDRRAVPPPAPLPVYQRQYTGNRYPVEPERQQTLRQQHYRYQPKDPIVREQQRASMAPERPQARQQAPQGGPPPHETKPRDIDRSSAAPKQKGPPQGAGPNDQQARGQPSRVQPQQPPQARQQPQAQPQPQPAALQQKGPPQSRGNDRNDRPVRQEQNDKGNERGRGQGGGKPQ